MMSGIEYLTPTLSISVLHSNSMQKSSRIDDLIRFIDKLVVTYFFGPPCRQTVHEGRHIRFLWRTDWTLGRGFLRRTQFIVTMLGATDIVSRCITCLREMARERETDRQRQRQRQSSIKTQDMMLPHLYNVL